MKKGDKSFMVWFKPSPIYAKNEDEASKKAYDYIDNLPDDWIEIDSVHEVKY